MRCLRERGGGERSPPGGWEERDNKAGDGDRCGGGGGVPRGNRVPGTPILPPGAAEGETVGDGKARHRAGGR